MIRRSSHEVGLTGPDVYDSRPFGPTCLVSNLVCGVSIIELSGPEGLVQHL